MKVKAQADGVLIGSPVYFASANGGLCALLDRVFYATCTWHQMFVNAPNMKDGCVKPGNIKLLYSSNNNLDKIRNSGYFNDWNFDDSKQTKELNLTHNLIAPKAGFKQLMNIYDKDPLIQLKNDIVAKIKRDKLIINEDEIFAHIVALVPIRNRQGQSKIDLILADSDNVVLYEQLKNLPFSQVKKST